MNGWNDYMMKLEQCRDQVREAERQRAIRLVRDNCQEPTLRQAIGNLVLGTAKRGPSEGQTPCGEYNHHLLEKAA